MQLCFSSVLRAGLLIASLAAGAFAQAPPSRPAKDEAKGLPPRAAPGDYQAQAKAGEVTIAAEFVGGSF